MGRMRPGALIAGKYRLLHPIGKGAMGAVWAARNELTQREFALKLLHPGQEASARDRLLREASASGRLRHRNVVAVYDVGITDAGEPFLVMEVLRGETLRAMLRREQRLDVQQALPIALSIARALSAAHQAGVVHRDLKPGNILLHEDPDHGRVVKVLDFGVSKLLDDDNPTATTTGTALGSPAYMSPEQARGQAVDRRSDLWAFGVVLFEMLAGRRPFDAPNSIAVVSSIVADPIPRLSSLLPEVSLELDDLVSRCLERDADLRVSSAEELLSRLESIAVDVPPDAAPPSVNQLPALPLPRPPPAVLDDEPTIQSSSASAAPITSTLHDDELADLDKTSDQTARTDVPPTKRPSWLVLALAATSLAALLLVGFVASLALGRLRAPSASPPVAHPAPAHSAPAPPPSEDEDIPVIDLSEPHAATGPDAGRNEPKTAAPVPTFAPTTKAARPAINPRPSPTTKPAGTATPTATNKPTACKTPILGPTGKVLGCAD